MTKRLEVDNLTPSQLDQRLKNAVQEVFGERIDEINDLRRLVKEARGVVDKHGAAEILNVSAKTVMRWAREEGLPCYQPQSKPYFLVEDIKAWLKEHPRRGG